MKRTLILAVITAFLLPFLFTSCQKEEGVFNPNKKIYLIFREYHYNSNPTDPNSFQYDVPRYMSEVWDWDEDQLKSISYFDEDAIFTCKALFFYQDTRIDSISFENSSAYGFWKFYYQKGLIDSMHYEDDYQTSDLVFIHSGNKISKINFEYYSVYGAKNTEMSFFPLRFVLSSLNPDICDAIVASMERNVTSKDGLLTNYVYDLEWRNGNVVKIKETSSRDNYINFTEYSYDKHTNPFHSSFFGQYNTGGNYAPDVEDFFFPTSKNNVLTSKMVDSRDCESSYSYSYVYDGPYPITQEKVLLHHVSDGEVLNTRRREVTCFEYK